jgi:hypothetical protein
MKENYAWHLLVQALLAGSAAFAILGHFTEAFPAELTNATRWLLLAGVLGQFLCLTMEDEMAPAGREAEFARATALIHHGPFRRAHLVAGLVGILAPFLILLMAPAALPVAAALALVGLAIEEDVFVRAGQALPIS